MEDEAEKRIVNHTDHRKGAGLKGLWLETREAALNEARNNREQGQLRRLEEAFRAYVKATDAYITKLELEGRASRKKAC